VEDESKRPGPPLDEYPEPKVLEERLFRAQLEARAWRARALAAEAQLAEYLELQTRPIWRIVTTAIALRSGLAPPGSRRDRTVRGAVGRLRSSLPSSADARLPLPRARAVLFASGRPGATRRYRCDHRAEQLRRGGASVDVAPFDEVDVAAAAGRYRCVVLHRVLYDSRVRELIERAGDTGTLVVYDADDLIFDPDVADLLPPSAVQKDGVGRQRATLAEAHAATVTTQPLAERARRFNGTTTVWPNVVSGEMVAAADAVASKRRRGDEVVVGYLSGTATHDRDFLEAADGVAAVLERNAGTRLRVIGKLTLPPRLARFGRVEHLPLVAWTELPSKIAELDISLAPLERGNPFAESKSALKFLEAALVGVPTVASPSPDFLRVIEPGRNGLIADGSAEWEAALSRLCESPKTRRALGEAAFRDVRSGHTAAATVRQGRALLGSLAGAHGDGPLAVRWLAAAHRELGSELASRAQTVVQDAGSDPVDVVVADDRRSAFLAASDDAALFRARIVDGGFEPADEEEASLPIAYVVLGDDGAAVERATGQLAVAVGRDGSGEELDRALRELCVLRLREAQ
jgi:glycosyltransferase involved in cell wall biosynthesis